MFECWFTKILVVTTACGAPAMGESRAYPIAKEGCPEECGGVPVPFPFGIGDGCFAIVNNTYSPADKYKINCDHSNNPPVPFLGSGIMKRQLLSINLDDESLRVSSGIAYECYSSTGKRIASSPNTISLYILGMQLSDRNTLVAVGCNTSASLQADNLEIATCNTSHCTDLEPAKNGICDSLHGCCEASVSFSTMVDIYIDQFTLDVWSGKNQGCHYAFVSEVGWYNFSTTNLTTSTPTDCDKIQVPLVYEWYTDSDNLTCGSNTDGNCNCLEGYTAGNPYLPPGCQDINECGEEGLNDCKKKEFCVNKNGGYECRCPDGHHGNGTITSPCIDVRDDEVAKPGCPTECSGVKIPFPFGIGPGCFAQGMLQFEIRCDYNASNPKPVLPFLRNTEVLSINIEDHTLRLSYGVAYKCYNDLLALPPATTRKNITLGNINPFTISTTRNKFVSIGCWATAWVTRGDDIYDGASSVCTTSCIDAQTVSDGTCDSTLGCCEASISGILSDPSIYVGNFSNNLDALNGWCFYAFVGEIGSYKVSSSNITTTLNDCDGMRVPVLYDWHLLTFNKNCSKSKMDGDGSYKLGTICRSNTQIEYINEDCGYRCQCLEGYNGNPYLPHGCQDINECQEERLNDCQKLEFCVNKDGGYDCKCPNGHHGNGTKASPCIRSPTDNLIPGLGIGMSSMIGLILLYGLYKFLKRRKDVKEKEHNFKKNGGLLLQQEMSTNEGAIDRTKIFSRSELERATDNFNNSRVLGCGGQGTVYKGMLVDGTIVAVKKSKKVDENQLAQFINEVVILSKINHRNIVKLFGCCLETEVPLLVYEFVPNGTLYRYIHHPDEDFQLTCKVRLQIAVECAGAVAYLHSSCSSPIYHRDIKSSNILLDEKHKAKISDFGTSRSISIDKTHVTTCVQGTFGYLDPEFFRSSQFSEKSDVYSFGVVLLELLTSKKPIFTSMSNEPQSLATVFVQLMEASPNGMHSMLDAQVLQECSEEEIETLAKLIGRCLSLSGKQRPTMREVAITLEMIQAQQFKKGDPANDQEVNMEEWHVWNNNEMGTTNEDYTSSSMSATTNIP